MKIKKGDTVKVIAGKDAKKTGKVIQILPRENKVVVDGVNTIVKHVKSQRRDQKGQRLEFFGPIDASNVMLIDPKTNETTRVGFKKLDNGQKVRVSKKTGQELE